MRSAWGKRRQERENARYVDTTLAIPATDPAINRLGVSIDPSSDTSAPRQSSYVENWEEGNERVKEGGREKRRTCTAEYGAIRRTLIPLPRM
jgi:hypothetical protein